MIKKSVRRVSPLIMALVMTACNSTPSLNVRMDASTILVLSDGTVQSVSVEEFNKNYYSADELGLYVNEIIQSYVSKVGKDVVKKEDLKVEDGTATLVLSYATVEDYSALNNIPTTLKTAVEFRNDESLPNTYYSVENKSETTKESALSNDNYKVLVTTDPGVMIQVEGKIKFYANANLVNKTTVEALEDGVTVVVFE